MHRCLRALLLFALFVSLFVSPAMGRDEELASDFTLEDVNMNIVTLSTYRDKQAVLLFFWTTWCPYCRGELQALNDMHSQLTRDGLEVLSVNVGESLNKVNKFTKVYFLTYKVLLNQDMSVAKSFEVLGVPTFILINQKGYVVFKDNYFPQEYKSLISKQENCLRQ